MVISIGIDVCEIERVANLLTKRPGIASRLFTRRESMTAEGVRTASSLAARFAAKEALIKALGGPIGLSWLEIEVITDGTGRPSFELSGAVAEAAAGLGITRAHLSLSHDGGHAVAMVVCEGDPT